MIDRCTWWRLSLSKYEGGQENGKWLRTRIAWQTDPFILDSLGLGMNGTNQKCKSRKRSRETTRGATTRTNVEKVLGMNRVGSPAIIPKCETLSTTVCTVWKLQRVWQWRLLQQKKELSMMRWGLCFFFHYSWDLPITITRHLFPFGTCGTRFFWRLCCTRAICG